MSAHNTSSIVPTLALLNTPNPVSGGDISGSSPLRSTTDHDRHLTSVTGAAGETRSVVSSDEHAATVEAKAGRANSYSLSRHKSVDQTTLREDNPEISTHIDPEISMYLSQVVARVKELRESTSFPSPGVAEEPLFHSLKGPRSRNEECQDSNNEASEERSSSPTSYVLCLDFSPTGIISSETDRESSGKPVSSPIQYTLSLEDVAFNNVSGADPPPPVDDIPSIGASSVVVANESSPDHSLYAAQLPYSRAASTTDGQSSPEGTVDDGLPEDTDLKPDMLESGLSGYGDVKEDIATNLPVLTLEGIKGTGSPEEIIECLRGICSACPAPERSRVNVVSESETLANISDAAPGSMVKVGVGNPR
ncbi:uncharacterized protein ARMOST_18222 [Armillaria ostoyae]|uniref:Uncharacterized protein n=1 Tax=Armillaria ostoyae TaxID=47428 RepID=A0A284S176_ARMOS|nr:uncharacterized protein ARMOST_18222 [Armillaria ostoyae]